MNPTAQPAFFAYAVACVLVCFNLMFLWFYSAFERARSKTAVNAEDAAAFKTALVDEDPPAVARVLRAHGNAQASIFPFLFLGLVFTLLGAGATLASVLFGIFVVARWLHSFAYLRGLQPWRTLSFLTGASVIGVLIVGNIVLLARM